MLQPTSKAQPNHRVRKILFDAFLPFALCVALVLTASFGMAAQDKPDAESKVDKTLFLVAHQGLGDPFFKESVVLMFPMSAAKAGGLIVGLIINKPTHVALSDIFPDDIALKDRTEIAYFGGPVEPKAPGVVFRSSKPDKEATLLFGDVYVSFDAEFIKSLLKKPGNATDMRLFVGRAQWAPAQLENELAIGAWYGMPAETSLIFNEKPDYLWHKLYDRAAPKPMAEMPHGRETARLAGL
jgi:putative transcriptional regulator